jgi:hypothetical protein
MPETVLHWLRFRPNNRAGWVAGMHMDFAKEYARRSDEEIWLLIKDRHNLVDEARDALEVEVQKRKRNGFQLHVPEPEKPRLDIEEDDDDVNVVVVHSRELRFPRVCPRCLAPADAVVRISCDGGSSWGLIPIVDYALGLWRYLFSRYSVPFCNKCAVSVRLRRWVERLFMVAVPAGSVYLFVRYHIGVFGLLVTCVCLYAAGFGIWILSRMPKRWTPAGIEILSGWSSKDRRLAFAKPEYEKAFVALNHARRRDKATRNG